MHATYGGYINTTTGYVDITVESYCVSWIYVR